MKKKLLTTILLSITASSALVGCNGGSAANNNASQDTKLQTSADTGNMFPTMYEFESFSQPLNLGASVCDSTKSYCVNISAPPPATHDIGQKMQQWTSQYSTGRITVSFNSNVNNFTLTSLTQSLNEKEHPVGVISEIYTPLDAKGISMNSCFKGSYTAGDTCTIGVTYKGLNFTGKTTGNPVKDIAEFTFTGNNSKLTANMELYNSHKTNAQNIGILNIEDSDDHWNYVSRNSVFNQGILNANNLAKVALINKGDGVISLNKNNHFAEISLGLSNPDMNLKDMNYYHDSYNNSFSCEHNAKSEVSPSNPCELYGIPVEKEANAMDSYFAHIVVNYTAQPSGEGKNPITIQAMQPIVISSGDMVPMDYDLKRNINIPSLVVMTKNVHGDNLAYEPNLKNVKFYLNTKLGAFVPYSLTTEGSKLVYDISDKYQKLRLLENDNDLPYLLPSLDISNDAYSINLGILLREAKQPTTGGILTAEYDENNTHISQIIGTINVDLTDERPKPSL